MLRGTALLAAAFGLLVVLGGCASDLTPVRTGYLSTYSNLEEQSATSWTYRIPNNRLARYDKFMVLPVKIALPEDAAGSATSAEDLKKVAEYMQGAMAKALEAGGNEVVDYPAPDVAELRIALTDAVDDQGRIGIAIEGEMIDSVSNVQLGALVESQKRGMISLLKLWRTRDAQVIMDGWAKRVQEFVDTPVEE